MKKKAFQVVIFILLLFGLSSFSYAKANDNGYTKSIQINGTNEVDYNYEKEETEEEEVNYNFNDNKYNYEQNNYIKASPYFSRWGYYNVDRYYPHYYYSGRGPVVFTYSGTGIKTGPDGRMLTPLRERDMYKYRPYHNHYKHPHHHPHHRQPKHHRF